MKRHEYTTRTYEATAEHVFITASQSDGAVTAGLRVGPLHPSQWQTPVVADVRISQTDVRGLIDVLTRLLEERQ